ncbi:RNA polymerase sigma factor [Microbulbifer litoralis]|uniref:RNA polymerase sigma factor n=1 Tax=Microbulbifer litoralis TaxID=2933965 RepID=UPI002028CA54|nr:RNA polymerase sigma factor [Microbulbifer sp. GX H0434]
MAELNRETVRWRLEEIYRDESRRVLATLIRLLGDFELAEEALHEAFAAALKQWPEDGIPESPRAWLVSTGRFKAIDVVRRRNRHESAVDEIARGLDEGAGDPADWADDRVGDDHLRLIFTCCHPALSMDARVALTLREVCGLTTEEIASAFLSSNATLAQRIVRAKKKIRSAGIPYQIPGRNDLQERLDGVLKVIYLVFNEGYSASSGESLLRADLSREAIRLGRLLNQLLPDPEVQGLLALMLLNESRRDARTDSAGDIVLLEDQDRNRWDRRMITEGIELVETALRSGRFGSYALQAAINAIHAEAPSADETDWAEIVALYDVLQRLASSPVVALNRAVAVAMRDGPEIGLELVEKLSEEGGLDNYHLFFAVKANFYRQLGRWEEARGSYAKALSLAQQEPERRFLRLKIQSLG